MLDRLGTSILEAIGAPGESRVWLRGGWNINLQEILFCSAKEIVNLTKGSLK